MSTKATNVLTTGEAARYCNVNFRTVIRWVEKGYLKAYKLPGRGDKRIPVDSFIEFLKENGMPIPVELDVDVDVDVDVEKVSTNRRILIVEDIKEMAEAIARTLKRAGFETKIAINGFQAGHLLKSFDPALMTLDIRMPGLSGIEVLDYTKNHPEYTNLKIIIISAQDEQQLQECIQKGADDALQKPFDNKDLVSLVCSHLGVQKKR